MPKTNLGTSTIECSIVYGDDSLDFLAHWDRLAPDRRTRAGRLWGSDAGETSIGAALFDGFKAVRNLYGNPLQWLEDKLADLNSLPTLVQENLDAILGQRAALPDVWQGMVLARPRDFADLILYRHDGTRAGSFSQRDLSDGQRNTAVLSMLLAEGNGPLLIDQPESELDNEFLYTQLVALIRAAKRKRQLIVVTHNANIPVIGDADLVYCLEAKGGRGCVSVQGGMDSEEVTTAVLRVMEGSREAFRRRKERYYF
jgi:hypothetical protein